METCDQVRAAVADGSLHTRTELGAHVNGCEVCAPLVAASSALLETFAEPSGADPSPLDTDALFTRLEGELEAERGVLARVRALSTPMRRALLVGPIALGALVLIALWVSKAGPTDVSMARAWTAGILSVFLLGTAAYALRPLHRPPMKRGLLRSMFLSAVGLVLGTGLLLSDGWTDAGAPWVARVGLPCLGLGLGVSVATYALFRLFDRSPARLSAFSGAMLGGLAGNLVLHLRCPHEEAQHFLIGHFGVVLLALLIAQAFSSKPALARR